MKLPGWCYRCRKPKRVNVRIPPARGHVAIGICDECKDKR